MLQDGCQVYQGPIRDLGSFFNDLGCNVGKFNNPADYVIKLAQVPELCGEGLTNERLEDNFESRLLPIVTADIQRDQNKFMGISTRLNEFSTGRKANYCKQFAVLFGRNWNYLLRNP